MLVCSLSFSKILERGIFMSFVSNIQFSINRKQEELLASGYIRENKIKIPKALETLVAQFFRSLNEFGAKEWSKYIGPVGSEPPLPPNMGEILDSKSPFIEGKTVQETSMLTLIPKTVNGKLFTLNYLSQLIQEPKIGNQTKYRYYSQDVKEELGSKSVDKSYWALMTRDVIPNSRRKSYDEQKELVQSYAQKSNSAYTLPPTLGAVTSILMEHVVSGKKLYSSNPSIYTRCLEKVNNQWTVAIGGFAAGGLFISNSLPWGSGSIGVGVWRKF